MSVRCSALDAHRVVAARDAVCKAERDALDDRSVVEDERLRVLHLVCDLDSLVV